MMLSLEMTLFSHKGVDRLLIATGDGITFETIERGNVRVDRWRNTIGTSFESTDDRYLLISGPNANFLTNPIAFVF
ncbi:hypothetical protein, partial [Clostridioides difficile]|uniref:hypothetical protein n=1 Tax=Clostridioides difficile TaxID=1496 RepID=UPI0021144A57